MRRDESNHVNEQLSDAIPYAASTSSLSSSSTSSPTSLPHSSCSSSPRHASTPPRREWDVDGVFERVVEFMRDDQFAAVTSKIADSDKLGFYGMYKQAVVGRCTKACPPISNVMGRMKWNAWAQLGAMQAKDAKMHYIQHLLRLKRSWEEDHNIAKDEVKRR